MGGNALKTLNPKRLSSAEVVNVFNHIQRSMTVRGLSAHLVPWIEEKTDHGDIDIITAARPADIREMMEDIAGYTLTSQAKLNDIVLSVPFPIPSPTNNDEVCQVDFICKDTPFYRFFYSGGDFGLLMGRVAAWHGLVFAQEGLRLRHDPTKPWSKDVLLTTKPREAMEFLGYGGYAPLFKTYQNMWAFVLSSHLAHPRVFMPESTNAENRSRDKQRAMTQHFATWLKEMHGDDFSKYPNRCTFEQAIDYVILNNCYGWPDIGAEIDKQRTSWEAAKAKTHALGMGAVEAVIDEPEITNAQKGEIIRMMHDCLPKFHIDIREYDEHVNLAKNIARLIAQNKGYKVK